MKNDKEEQEIIEAFEKGKMKLSSPSEAEIAEMKATAVNTLKKDKPSHQLSR